MDATVCNCQASSYHHQRVDAIYVGVPSIRVDCVRDFERSLRNVSLLSSSRFYITNRNIDSFRRHGSLYRKLFRKMIELSG